MFAVFTRSLSLMVAPHDQPAEHESARGILHAGAWEDMLTTIASSCNSSILKAKRSREPSWLPFRTGSEAFLPLHC